MKKKLKGLDVRVQTGAVVVLLLLVAFLGYTMLVSPQKAQAKKLAGEVSAQQTLIYKKQAALRAGLHPPAIETADLFRLARAMPDREDMPGIILTLSQVARAAGIHFNLIEPGEAGSLTAPAGSYQTERIHLQFDGDFYGLSDFLYRLRSLVAVHDGKLEATGRLFNVDTVSFAAAEDTFPQISADLFVDAYVYAAPAPTEATTPSSTDSSSTSTDSTDSTVTASGVTP